MKILFFFIFIQAQLTLASIYAVTSEFKNQNHQFQKVSGIGFSIQTAKTKYFVSPYHVLGGQNPSLPENSQAIYSDPASDVIVFKLADLNNSIVPILVYASECHCLKLNKKSFQSETESYYFSNRAFSVLPKNFLDENFLKLSQSNRHGNFDNLGRASNSGHLVFDVVTKSGFSGSPIIAFDSQVLGFVIRYDRYLNQSFVFPISKLYQILDTYEQKPINNILQLPGSLQPASAVMLQNLKQNTSIQYQLQNNQLFKQYKGKMLQKAGGDTSDGGNTGLQVSQGESGSSTGLSVDGVDIAYFQIAHQRFYPNHSAYDFLSQLNIDLSKIAVLDKDNQTERVLFPFEQLHASSLKIVAFRLKSGQIVLDDTKASIVNQKLNLSVRFLSPIECEIKLVFDRRGVVISEGKSQFESILSLNKCNQNIVMDFRSFFFINLDSTSYSIFDLVRKYSLNRPKIALKVQDQVVDLEFVAD